MIGRKRTFAEAELDDEKQENNELNQTNPTTDDNKDPSNDVDVDDDIDIDINVNDNNTQNPTNANNTNSNSKSIQSDFSPEYLQIYYDRLFPYQELFNWLSYFNDPTRNDNRVNRKYWRNREFSFTLKDDIYLRYKSYKDLSEFKLDVRKKNPYKIDIGAIYNVEPNRKATIPNDKFIPEEKEFVIDIDISDYDDVRKCCKDAGICNKCWPLMSCSIKIIDISLRNDFGFKHMLWVFSGRRGIHCWIGDQLPRTFDSIGRSAIIDYLKLYSGNAQNRIKVDMNAIQLGFIHDSHQRAYDICKEYFKKCSIKFQKILDDEDGIHYLCNQIRDKTICDELRNKLLECIDKDCEFDENVEYKWSLIENTFHKYITKLKSFKDKLLLRANKMEIIFSYVYPRLDVEVSRHKNHLLKCPFVIHPKTGKVCTIIDPKTCDQFDPLNQPTLSTLIDELNSNPNTTQKIGWKDTSLRNTIETFRETFLDDLRLVNEAKFRD